MEFIEYEERDRVAIITLNRPERRNAQHPPMLRELDAAWTEAAHSEDVRVILLKANGPHFSAGHDLNVDPSTPQFYTSNLVASMPSGFSVSGTPTTNQVTITHNMGSYPINAVLHGVTSAGLVKVTPIGANSNNTTFSDTTSFSFNIQQFATAGATTGGKLRAYIYF